MINSTVIIIIFLQQVFAMNTPLTQGDSYLQSQQPEEVATKSWEDKNAISILEVTFLIFF